MKKVTILIPCYNEEQSLPLLYQELSSLIDNHQAYDWEILFVNDGSKDNTIHLIKQLSNQDNRIAYVDLSRNFGKEAAVYAGLSRAGGDFISIIDADLQQRPEIARDMGVSQVQVSRLERRGLNRLRELLVE